MRLRRRLRINAQGKELYKFINDIRSQGVTCLGQYVQSDVFHGEIYRRDLKKVRNSAENLGIELKEAEFVTVMSVLYRYRKRVGILLGITVAFLCCLYFSQTVTEIEIQGNSTVTDEVILSALSQLDVKCGSHIRDIDMHYCEHELQIRIGEIAWAAIRRTGSRIVVQVTEITPKPDMLLERVPCNIVAARDAVITEVNVLDGMLMHKVGDFVPEGTLLINGIAEDDTGHMTIHHAYGLIRGIYTETAEFRAEFRPQTYVQTGRSDKQHYLRLFNVDIPLFFGRNKYNYSDVETVEKPLKLFGKKLPVSVVVRDIRETELSEREYTEEELDHMLMEKLYLFEKNFLDGCRVIKRDIKRERDEDGMRFRAEYRVEGEIGQQRDIFIK
ncbi:MAG: sporulation protein YqfD [Ruminococcus sp.]|nr:sporulation protein YqfD [Ruminococcus sp.]